MFDWLFGDTGAGVPGLMKIRAEFGQMLEAGRHAFMTAANAFLGGTDPEVIREDLFATDKRINRAERQIRRELVVHATVHGAAEFPPCLVLMSIVKDAERIGDNAKNLFDLTELAPKRPEGPHLKALVELKDRIGRLLTGCREIFDSCDLQAAKALIVEAKNIEDVCDQQIRELIQHSGGDEMAVPYTLAYRYFKRVTAHARNIASSVVQPLHKLDFTSKITTEEQS